MTSGCNRRALTTRAPHNRGGRYEAHGRCIAFGDGGRGRRGKPKPAAPKPAAAPEKPIDAAFRAAFGKPGSALLKKQGQLKEDVKYTPGDLVQAPLGAGASEPGRGREPLACQFGQARDRLSEAGGQRLRGREEVRAGGRDRVVRQDRRLERQQELRRPPDRDGQRRRQLAGLCVQHRDPDRADARGAEASSSPCR